MTGMAAMLSRAIMALAVTSMRVSRPDWAEAMAAEYDAAAGDGHALPFAVGCLVAALRELPSRASGRFALSNHAVVLSIVVPMGALQLASVALGLSDLFPGGGGLSGALPSGGSSKWLTGFYQSIVPVLAVLQLALAIGHVRLAWAMLDRDWAAASRWAARTLAAATTLICFMGALFIDIRQVLVLGAIVAIEVCILMTVSDWHGDLCRARQGDPPD